MAPTPKVWFVTSASTGLGRAVTEYALQQGDNVVAVLPKPKELSDILSKYPSQILPLSVDVNDPNQICVAFDNALGKFGRVDIVLNNDPGFCIVSEAEGMNEGRGREMFETLFWGAVNVSKETVRTFRDRNSTPGGHLLQVSSWATLRAIAGVAHYAAAKAALECFSHGMAIELDPSWNIKISIVQPALFWEGSPESTVIDPVHSAYSDPDLPSRATRNLYLGESKVGRYDVDLKKFARVMHRLACSDSDDLPFFLPLHRVTLEAARERGRELIQAAEDYASWSEDVYLSK